MVHTLYNTHYCTYFDFTTDELDEVQELASKAINFFDNTFFQSTKACIIEQMLNAHFSYDENDQSLNNRLIFNIESPNKIEPGNIECIIYFNQINDTIEVYDICAFFA
jgi:hypothetical protein